ASEGRAGHFRESAALRINQKTVNAVLLQRIDKWPQRICGGAPGTEAENRERGRRNRQCAASLVDAIDHRSGALLYVKKFAAAIHQHSRRDLIGQRYAGNSGKRGPIRRGDQCAIDRSERCAPSIEEETAARIDGDASPCGNAIARRTTDSKNAGHGINRIDSCAPGVYSRRRIEAQPSVKVK